MTERDKKSVGSLGGSVSERKHESPPKNKYCEVCNSKGSPHSFKKSGREKELSPEKQLLLDKMEEIRLKMTELEKVNSHLKT